VEIAARGAGTIGDRGRRPDAGAQRHIRRDNPIRAVEQTEGVLHVPGAMPAASGKPDHERVNDVLKGAMDRMLARLAQRYDQTIDDRPQRFGTMLDRDGLYAIIAARREESWRDAARGIAQLTPAETTDDATRRASRARGRPCA
jgi:Family of unknown function (DUF5995)